MRTDRRLLRWIAGAAALPLIGWMLSPDHPWLLYNRTPSVPTGFYRYDGSPDAGIERGDLVAFPLPEAAHAYARRRGEGTDVLLLKPVLAVAGDRVSTLNGELRINGVRVGMIPATDSMVRALPRWRAARVLEDGELFVGSTRTVHSFDSRLFGPIHASQAVGVYRPLWLGSTGGVPSSAISEPPEPGSLHSERLSTSVATRG